MCGFSPVWERKCLEKVAQENTLKQKEHCRCLAPQWLDLELSALSLKLESSNSFSSRSQNELEWWKFSVKSKKQCKLFFKLIDAYFYYLFFCLEYQPIKIYYKWKLTKKTEL